jgi:hypothetical protein
VKLTQTRGVLRIDSEIVADGVFYRERNLLSSSEATIPFEHISSERVRSFHVPRLYLFITLFFALLFAFRLIRYVSGEAVFAPSLIWSAVLLVLPAVGTWMQSPKFVGYLTSRGGLLIFDKRGPQDPGPYLDEIQRARAAYIRGQYSSRAVEPGVFDDEPGPPDSALSESAVVADDNGGLGPDRVVLRTF